MSLSRTIGLAAEYLFHGVDVVVWTEGGNAVSPVNLGEVAKTETAVEQDLPTAALYGDDIQFWRGVFGHVRPKMRARFKPAGSKERIKEIAAQIQTERLSNVIACMDRDHDDLTGELIVDANVIYTRLYSWENDCWTIENVLVAFEHLYSGTQLPDEIVPVLESQEKHLNSALRWHVKADVLRSIGRLARYVSKYKKGISSHSGTTQPRLKTSFLMSNCGERGRGKFRILGSLAVSVRAQCVGHIIGSFYFHTLRAFVHKYLKEPLSKLTAKTLVVDAFLSSFPTNTRANSYYRNALKRIRAPRRRNVSKNTAPRNNDAVFQ